MAHRAVVRDKVFSDNDFKAMELSQGFTAKQQAKNDPNLLKRAIQLKEQRLSEKADEMKVERQALADMKRQMKQKPNRKKKSR